MVMLKNKQLLKNLFVIVVCLVGILPASSNVGAVSEICKKSEKCMEAAAKEAEANKNAAEAENSANAYQAKVNELSVDIASKEAEIADTEAQIKALKAEIIAAEKKLTEEQDALAELLVTMHFESDAEPIKILAGASSISDLAEKAAREEVVKEQISASATKVKEMKAQLEANKAAVEDLLSQQQVAKKELMTARTEQQELVTKYENDAEAYAAEAKEAQLAQQAAIQEYQETHRQYFQGSAYSGANTYPWQDECPGGQDSHITWIQVGESSWLKIGGYVCECVSYAGWKAYEAYGVAPAWGNAYSWDSGARAAGYRVDNSPAAGTIGQMDDGPYGHVFWVESVNEDGSINVTEYNNYWSTGQLTGSYHVGDFGARKISASEASRYNYIHFD